MKLRDALIQQSPNLALQRAAQEEIARLDAALQAHAELRTIARRVVRAAPDQMGELLLSLEAAEARIASVPSYEQFV